MEFGGLVKGRDTGGIPNNGFGHGANHEITTSSVSWEGMGRLKF